MSDAAPPPAGPAGPTGPTGFDAGLRERFARDARFVANFEQDVLSITVDKIRLQLRDFEHAVKAGTAWQGPASLALGFFANAITFAAAPKDFPLVLGFNRDQWLAIHILGTVIAGLTACGRGYKAFRSRKDAQIETAIAKLRAADTAPAPAAPPAAPPSER